MSILDADSLFVEALQRLREAARTDRALDAAKVQLINLPEIIANAGAQWPLLKDKIRIGSMGFLRGCLADDDIIIPAGDGFLIIFAEGESEALKHRAQELRMLLLEFYLGEETLKKLKINVKHHRVAADELHTLLAPAPQPAQEPIAGAFAFAPMWTLRASVIGSYLCTPIISAPSGIRQGYDESYHQAGQSAERDFCALDLSVVDAVEAALNRLPSNVAQPVLGVSVHVTTLASRSARSKYLERLSRIPKDKLKFMFIRIAEIDTGTPMINLADWVGMLRTRIKYIQAEFHYSESPPSRLSDVGISSAGFRSPAGFERGAGAAIHGANLYQNWGAMFSRQRLPLFIDCVRTTPLIKAAVDSGVSFLTNDLLWPYAQAPGGIVRDVNPLETSEDYVFVAP